MVLLQTLYVAVSFCRCCLCFILMREKKRPRRYQNEGIPLGEEKNKWKRGGHLALHLPRGRSLHWVPASTRIECKIILRSRVPVCACNCATLSTGTCFPTQYNNPPGFHTLLLPVLRVPLDSVENTNKQKTTLRRKLILSCCMRHLKQAARYASKSKIPTTEICKAPTPRLRAPFGSSEIAFVLSSL